MTKRPRRLGSSRDLLLQATEALKLAAGIGRPLTRRMLFVDLLNMDMHEMRYSRLKGCPCCGGTAC